MNKIKDDELDTNVQSEEYKIGAVQWGRPLRKQVTDANEQKQKITLPMTFKTEFGGIKYE